MGQWRACAHRCFLLVFVFRTTGSIQAVRLPCRCRITLGSIRASVRFIRFETTAPSRNVPRRRELNGTPFAAASGATFSGGPWACTCLLNAPARPARGTPSAHGTCVPDCTNAVSCQHPAACRLQHNHPSFLLQRASLAAPRPVQSRIPLITNRWCTLRTRAEAFCTAGCAFVVAGIHRATDTFSAAPSPSSP